MLWARFLWHHQTQTTWQAWYLSAVCTISVVTNIQDAGSTYLALWLIFIDLGTCRPSSGSVSVSRKKIPVEGVQRTFVKGFTLESQEKASPCNEEFESNTNFGILWPSGKDTKHLNFNTWLYSKVIWSTLRWGWFCCKCEKVPGSWWQDIKIKHICCLVKCQWFIAATFLLFNQY